MSENDDLLQELENVKPEGHLPLDTYRDFRKVFLGSDEGKRVLREILVWGNINRSSAERAQFETNKTMFYDGQRSMAIKIMYTINTEPKNPPSTANNQEKK